MRCFLTSALCALLLAGSAAADDEVTRFAALVALEPGMTLADIGTGDGSFALALARYVGAQGRVYATEMEAEQLEAIRAGALEAGVSNLEVREAKLDGTNLPDGCCDVILMRHVYHHLTEPAAVNQDVLRALVAGGRFVVVDFPPNWLLRLFTPEGVNEARRRHGIEPVDAVRELRAAGFEHLRTVDPYRSRWLEPDSYALVFRKPPAP